ncbi:hypothetical protein [Afifella sp. IM 167]|uniref:hypothetical protein n=1 Tax=Afifella sp. IM 167 TaxID=2033586 RepID=UPI001CCC2D8F|nr:hypothetical protein [Afifella sp. IM 167]MBZ8132569.1 hypothetical protein [Afifella sp. IM 167]
MRFFRRLQADRLSGGLVAAIVVYTLLFQGIVVATAHGAMANGAPVPDFILCSQHRVQADEADAGRSRLPIGADRSCCDALCQAACAVGAALAPHSPSFDVPSMSRTRSAAQRIVTPAMPASLGLAADATGPPSILL